MLQSEELAGRPQHRPPTDPRLCAIERRRL